MKGKTMKQTHVKILKPKTLKSGKKSKKTNFQDVKKTKIQKPFNYRLSYSDKQSSLRSKRGTRRAVRR